MEAAAAGGAAAGVYPVDILEDDPEGYRKAALAYYARLREGAQPSTEVFSLPTGEQVKLEVSSVCFCTVHRDEPQHQILVLVNPQATKTVVAVYIKESWWPPEDVLRTSDPAREGLMKEEAKILWRDGAAVGFYTTKMKGSLCGEGVGVCYLLPVLDTVFVRRKHRRQGLGVAMLRDFCATFHEDEALGVSWPISPAMYQVCRKFLSAHPEERGRLWEVEPPGAWGQRGSIWLKVQLQESRLPDRESTHLGSSKEDVSSPRPTSRDDGPRPADDGERNKERTSGEELERIKDDQDCGVEDACGAERDGKGTKRTAAAAGLAGGSWQKHVRPSS
ncbi:protein FAM169B isoform X5 [Rhinolophus sinicus]|uniref:protein FAM169B isoform X5 n=1 Tax=Rhinolophus sinicus TaxID=89399 RepID=UPI003D79E356